MSSKFKKTKEDFSCEYCGNEVAGNGFTNHCPKCFWSKHVDEFPGDRASNCGGMMEPIGAEESGGEWSVVQKCQKCGKVHKNKLSKEDNFEQLIKIAKDKSLE